jgi:uncharacterized protein (TIGR03435 family)
MRRRLIWHRHVLSLGSAAISLGLLVGIPRLHAQAPAVTPTADVKVPSYDVVSIKPDHTDTGRISIRIDDGNFDALNVSLKTLILGAYNLKEAQLFGLPKWGDSAHFDIKAKIIAPDKKQLEALTPEQFASMQQPILTDRFQLKFHHEKKVLPVYELVTIKGGPKFKEITPAEQKSDAGVNGVRAGGMSVHNRNLVATGVPIARLVDQLSAQLQRVVVDKTGLAGNYNFQLTWSPDDAAPPSPDVAAPPDIFTALEEQLGLKLQPGKEEIDTLVIDHVEYPSEN